MASLRSSKSKASGEHPEASAGFGGCSESSDSIEHPSSEYRQRMIAENAYYRAQKRDFIPGSELADWFDAEADVERELERCA